MGHNEMSGVVAEPVHGRPAVGGAQIEGDAYVHATGAEVPVHHPGEPVPIEKAGEVVEIVGQSVRGDRGILPAGPGLVTAVDVVVIGVGQA